MGGGARLRGSAPFRLSTQPIYAPTAREGNTKYQTVFFCAGIIHSLFDRGYVTVTPDLRFEVSRKIREEFENGRHYYSLHGSKVHVPEKPLPIPEPGILEWHNENRFLG